MCQVPPVNVGRADGGVTPGVELLGLAALLDLPSPGKKGDGRDGRSQGDIIVCTLVLVLPPDP